MEELEILKINTIKSQNHCGNVYIAFYSTALEELWSAPINEDGTISHEDWVYVEDENFINEYINSEKRERETITLDKFRNIINN